MVEILVVEDFEPFRRCVMSIVQEHPGLQVIGEVSDGVQAVQKVDELHPDLVLLDIGLPNLNGIEAARRIRNVAAQSRIIFLTQENSPEIVSECFNLGASGYILKLDARSDLLSGVDAVVRGQRFVSRSLLGQGIPNFTDSPICYPSSSSSQSKVA
jgi:DNA-binding NarL/FixJ family response regulator